MGSRYFLRRVLQAMVTLVLIVLLNFVLFRMMPGSPDRILARNMPEAARTELLARWQLDRPLIPDQLVAYLGATLEGDLGDSYKFRGQTVTDVIGSRVGPTVLLFGLAEVLAIIIGLALGAWSGWRRGGIADRIGNGISLVFYSMPYFVIAMPLIIGFAAVLHWFPTSGFATIGATYASPLEQVWDIGSHLVLPLVAVTIGLVGGYSILMRASIIETRAEDYVTTARAKGLSDGRILRTHALPNALLPTVSLIAISLAYVIGGAIALEEVFAWPGIGTLTVDALSARDYPVLQGIFLLLSVAVVFANVIADLVYSTLDPRVHS